MRKNEMALTAPLLRDTLCLFSITHLSATVPHNSYLVILRFLHATKNVQSKYVGVHRVGYKKVLACI